MTDTKLTLGQAIDQIITALEGLDQEARNTAIAAACAHLNVKMSPAAQGHGAGTRAPGLAESAVAHHAHVNHGKKVDIRSLKEGKNPESAKQMACVVAYYLQELAPEGERKDTISTQDIEKYFKQASFKLPKKVEQVLVDAKRSGYFESAARGEYKLNAVGYNLVVHGLPEKKRS
jgi:hypothetical protein